jgi:HprK-related kinase A
VQISQLSPTSLFERLKRPGVYFRTGPFVVHLRTDIFQVAEGVRLLYGDFPIVENGLVADFHVSFVSPRGLRRWFRPQVRFLFDGESPFSTLPVGQAFAMFEWCSNWCISSSANQYLIIHAAAVERDGYAAILPGPPGVGKSTLCAALTIHGWRLLTDELTLIEPVKQTIVPLARPIALKSNSLLLIQRMAPNSVFGPACHNTAKGTIAHMRPPTESVLRVQEPALPGWVVFPKYNPECGADASPRSKGQTFMWFAGSSFNYTLLGRRGFETLADLIDRTDCFSLDYGSLDAAIAWFDRLKPPAGATKTPNNGS